MEPMASPTWSDLLQTIKEKKYRVSADYLLREIAGEYAIIPVGIPPYSSGIHFSNRIPFRRSLHRRQKSMRLRRKRFKIPY